MMMLFPLKADNCLSWAKLTLIFLPIFSLQIQSGASSNILIFILQCSYSQLNVHHPYAVGLIEAGHDVTFVSPTPYKSPHPNISYLIPDKVGEMWETFGQSGEDLVKQRDRSVAAGETTNGGWDVLPLDGVEFCKLFFQSSGVKAWVESSKFDLVVIDGLYNDCGMGLALKWKAPFIYLETSAPLPGSFDAFGVIPENSWLPDAKKRWTGDMSFFQRVENVYLTLWMHLRQKSQKGYFDELQRIFREELGIKNVPSLEEYEKEASLVLYNSHYSMDYARSLPPLYVPIGGIQCKETAKKDLPENIAKFVAKFSGFIYISFGTFARLTPEKQEIFLMAFYLFPKIGFVMKWHGDKPRRIPENALLLDFAPQQALLANEKILAFASHGGMLSTQEVVYYGVPVIGLPVFAEQDYNVEALRRLGVAIKLEIATLTTEELRSAISKFLATPSYKENMQRVSKLSKDRPRHPLDEAVWWTNYVLRNAKDGTLSHLKPLGIHQIWFQRRCLDVWGFIFSIATLAIYVLLKIGKLVVKIVLKGGASKKQKKA